MGGQAPEFAGRLCWKVGPPRPSQAQGNATFELARGCPVQCLESLWGNPGLHLAGSLVGDKDAHMSEQLSRELDEVGSLRRG